MYSKYDRSIKKGRIIYEEDIHSFCYLIKRKNLYHFNILIDIVIISNPILIRISPITYSIWMIS